VPACEYGTEPTVSAPVYVWQTRQAIRDALGSGVLAWLLSSTIPNEPKLIVIADLCASLPDSLPSFDPAWLTNPLSMLTASAWLESWYRAYLFGTYCQ
jgi:hypothetical protein